LRGDIKTANEKIDELQNKATTIAAQTNQHTDKAIKEYIKAKSDLQLKVSDSYVEIQNHQDDAIKNIKEYATTMPTSTDKQSQLLETNHKYQKSYPDEYMINGKFNTIQVKKFQEDKTKLSCNPTTN
jgi:F0F1-type ATP synthase membrane subunit b/b'